MLFRGCGLDELARAAQREPIAVPARGAVIEDGLVFVRLLVVAVEPEHGAAVERAERVHARGDAAAGQALGYHVSLGRDALLTLYLRGRGVEQDVHGELRVIAALRAGEHALVAEDHGAPDLLRCQGARAGLYPRVVQVDQHAVAYLLGEPRYREAVADDVVGVELAVELGLPLRRAALDYGLSVVAVEGLHLASREVEDAVPVRAGAEALLNAL